MPQLFEMTIKASGEVRDKDGNLISVDPVTGTAIVTEDQAKSILEHLQGEQS